LLEREQVQAWLMAPGQVELRRVPVPRPASGQVLVRVECALAGGTDRKAFARGHPQIPMPGPFGHRYAGTVAALGPDATGFAVGEPIMGVHSAPCLQCDLCRKERWHLCPDVMKHKVLGAFGQYLCIPEAVARQNLFPRPQTLSPEHAALLEPLACVAHGLEIITWRGVERVLVLGLGAMGLLFLQVLSSYTTAQLIGAGRRDEGLRIARGLGTQIWDVRETPLAERIAVAGRFDCVIECTGNLEGWRHAFDATAPGGQVLLFGGVPRGVAFSVDSYRLHYEEVRVLGSFHFSPRDVAKARHLLLAGNLELNPLITERLPLARLPEALRQLEAGQGIQYGIDPWS
jgi:L-iditol 2-dehydrogenase